MSCVFCVSPFCRKEFKLDEAVEKFAIYDKWADFEYKFSVQVRYWTSGLSAVFGPSPSFFPLLLVLVISLHQHFQDHIAVTMFLGWDVKYMVTDFFCLQISD